MASHFSLLLLLLMHLSHGQEASHDAAVSMKGADNNIRHLHSSGLHRQYYCGLQNAPIMQVAKNETSGTLYKIDENTTTSTDQVFAVKQCACYSWLINETSMFCSSHQALIFSFSLISCVPVYILTDTYLILFHLPQITVRWTLRIAQFLWHMTITTHIIQHA